MEASGHSQGSEVAQQELGCPSVRLLNQATYTYLSTAASLFGPKGVATIDRFHCNNNQDTVV